MTKLFISVAFGVMAVAIVVLLYAIGFLILRFIWRMLKRLLPDGIGSPIYILVAFSLAAAVFTTTVSSVWTVVFYVIQFTLVNVPQFVLSGFGTTEDCDFSVPTENGEQAESLSNCISKAGAAFGSNFVAFVQNFFEQRPAGPSVAYVLGFLALAAMLMVLFNDRKADEQHAPPFFIRYFADATLEIRNRFAIGLILAAAVYLSLCAIAAVSLFKPSNISILSKEQFEAKLNHSKLELNAADNAPNSFKVRFPDNLGVFVNESGATPFKTAKSYASLNSEFEAFVHIWTQIRVDIANVQDRLLRSASADYELKNISRVGSREQALHFLNLERWYQSSLNKLFEHLDNCRNAILTYRLRAHVWMARELEVGSSGDKSGSTTADRPPLSFLLRSSTPANPEVAVRAASGRVAESCRPRPRDFSEALPERGAFGADLGPISSLAGWLLKTESIPLALIVGLVGFGLFGSLVSSVVRTDLTMASTDVFGLIIRGVSAAIVVFLAAYGGLAIVGAGTATSDPNPYVVFVTCLVAAVYSELVWSWARTKILAALDEKDGGDRLPAATPPAAVEQPPAAGVPR